MVQRRRTGCGSRPAQAMQPRRQALRIRRRGNFTGNRPFPNCSVFAGNPSSEEFGEKPPRFHERREKQQRAVAITG
jgi:hypothetical protein